ncbi:MAG: alpha/beta hydrolase [Woeseiaceae bacterium]|nr:alpha/beta hydrolase [Woeseiaceae bacterium]
MSVFLAILLLVLSVFVGGYLLTRDWARTHRARTAKLPLVGAGDPPADGLVRIATRDGEFRARLANFDKGDEALLLLHGFPQSSASWEPLIERAAAAGYRVVAYDQRGYSPGARPRPVDEYAIDRLVGDVLAVADALRIERFHLIGHDWGAAIGWALVLTNPARVLSWTALSIAHSYAFLDAVRNDPDQRRRSAYFLLFRLRGVAELLLGWGRQRLLRKLMYRCMPASHVEEYQAILSEPGALRAALNYYRAMGRRGRLTPDPEVTVPTLFIWGNRDPAAGRTAAEATARYMRGEYRFVELDAGHWLLETRTGAVVSAVLGHVSANSEATRPDQQS